MNGVDVAVCNAQEFVTSPDGAVKVTVGVKSKQAFYEVSFHGKEVVSPSRLGFLLADGETGTHARMGAVSRSSKDETWQQLWGEDESVRNHYNELTVNYKEQTGRTMQVIFRVFNDGFGFRYVLPDYNKGKEYMIMDEMTEFRLTHDAKAWSIPSNHTEYFEGIYTQDMLSKKDTVCTPLTIEYEPNLFLAIHEAALEDYASLNLAVSHKAMLGANGATSQEGVSLRAALTPWQSGVKVYAQGEKKTPWRTMIISKTAGGLLTSRLMLNLNELSGGAFTRSRTHGRWDPHMEQPHKT